MNEPVTKPANPVSWSDIEKSMEAAGEIAIAANVIAGKTRDTFPNVGYGIGHGAYGMFRNNAGHTLAVRRCLRALRSVASTFDCLYVTGMSGAIPAAVIAYMMQKELLVLRKHDEHGYVLGHGNTLEGDSQRVYTRYMIVDDFVSSGSTLARMLKYLPTNGKLVGVMLYGHPRSSNEIAAGKAKMFTAANETSWELIRRGPKSMLFDLVRT